MKQAPKLTFWQKLWLSIGPALLILLADIILFLTVLAALTVALAGVAGLKALGMTAERAEILERMHFYAYAAVLGIFLLDLVLKILFEVLRKKQAT